ncbi:cupin domain-containing protein [Pararhizobium sp.]|uniref:cupin domain-containing protein n=1 Tax=Pararhizobium sp. TaxID=1977563 RepID=UPI0027205A0A|nr:cupin domain-containing protein [Pararhizobium sp.]MDO9418892.1 cupin domain-containing protein [Pararhizobium sp.]
MFHHISRAGQNQGSNRTILFEGKSYGAPVSLFLVDNAPGEGPGLHTHPYAETWVVRAGLAEFTVGAETLKAHPGDIIVVEPETPHRFRNAGTDRLELTCIHASDHVIQTWL